MSDKSLNDKSFQQEMGVDRQGVKKGSRLVPLLLLATIVVIFIAFVIKLPLPHLKLKADGQLLTQGTNTFVIAKVQEAEEETLRFQVFDRKGNHRVKITSEEEIINAIKEEEKKREIEKQLASLKEKLKDLWDKEDIPLQVQSEIMGDVITVTDYEPTPQELAPIVFNSVSSVIANDFFLLLRAQLKAIWALILCSLASGLFGMIYRRAFWAWFLAAFLILSAINWGYSASGTGSIGAELTKNLRQPLWTPQLFLFVEVLLILVLLAYNLRRHSGELADPQTKRNNIVVAVILILLAMVWFFGMWKWDWLGFSLLQSCGALILLLIGLAVLRQTLATAVDAGRKGKNIVLCLDGTWNQPGQLDFGYLAETNVFKLFKMLKGKTSRKRYHASRCREYLDNQQSAKQIAFYYNGVGNKVENSQLGQLFGGAFGMGANAIVERAYLDVVRVYRPSDRIFIYGFSRGAAIARLVAGVIGRRGVPTSLWTLRLFGRHWTVWKSPKVNEDVSVDVLGCWDTVGTFGISKNILGIPFQKVNLLKDLTVSLCVKRAYHMVALDETRDSFEPTLMDPDPTAPERIIEVWFSGNHSNVGGGYATDKLSNVTLDFLLSRVSSGYSCDGVAEPGKDESWGLYLSAMRQRQGNGNGKDTTVIDPDPLGRIRHSTGAAYSYAPRKLPIHAVIYDSVFERMKNASPVYAPQSLFDLNEELVKKREDIETEVKRLVETHSMKEEESERIRNWSNEKLTLTKWSKLESDDKSKVKDNLKNPE